MSYCPSPNLRTQTAGSTSFTPSIRDLEARVAFEIFHEMVQRRPLRSAGRCTEASQLGYRVCDIDSHPCCCELELCHKRPIVLLFARIRQHRYICRIENNTRRDWHLLGEQHLLDVLLVIRQNLLDKKVLSFISNRQRRKEGTFRASELAGIEPTPP